MNAVRDNKGFTYVYVLASKKDGKWYTGCTNDLRKRLKQHQDGKATSTKNRGPLVLIYYEASRSDEDAFNREIYLKTGMGKRYLRNRLRRFLSLTV
ncbi:GIY-YIG nuclease family protein [Patescibacteria group bacterium]|nr:GIY-YIG nuclease family protein [Patescibacteria group bacterium]MDE2021798.1 GIY-YIG nuclease family protein [Patescibacteria group bacterium]MDE2173481.1 GIY-YIG nuclease family protein [Patescibacteria group bacterium]